MSAPQEPQERAGRAKWEGGESVEDEACAAALASFGLSPARLRRVLEGRRPGQAWLELAAGSHPEDPDGRVGALVRPDLPNTLWRRCRSSGVSVVPLGDHRYPPTLGDDAEAPAVLFLAGRPGAMCRWPRVAVVGTRSASTAGRQLAAEVGGRLAEAGVVVVSGLAPGIDSAALAGATEVAGGTVVAVLGTAHDGIRDPVQLRLARRVEDSGCVVSELPPGSASARWRFAVRNRVMAALAQLVVVVECHSKGGALHTVRAARRRAVPVAAVPGSLRASASAGTNELLVGGASCVRHGDDVVALLAGLTGWRPAPARCGVGSREPGPGRGEADLFHAPRPEDLDPPSRRVLEALDGDPVALEALVLRTRESLSSVALALEHLAEAGWASSHGGLWARTGRRSGRGWEGRACAT